MKFIFIQRIEVKLNQYIKFLSPHKDSSKSAFSLIEITFALFVIGLLGITTIKSITSLKSYNYSMQKFLLNYSSIFETQIFIHKYLSFAQSDSIKIIQNGIKWHGYTSLFLPTNKKDYMNFSLQTSDFNIQLINNNLYFNNAILLHNVKKFEAQITNNILHYKICVKTCINDFILLDNIEQVLP